MLKIKSIVNIVGFLLIIEGLFILMAIPFSLYYNDGAIISLASCGLGTSLIGLIAVLFTREQKREIRKREGYVVVSLGWFTMSLFGALPFVVSGAIPGYTDAFFETISGFTTTGASILNNIESIPQGLLFWRSLTQWLGGMGIIVLSLAILPILGIGGMQLFVAEVPGITKDKIHPRVSETAKRLWIIYFLLTLAELILLMIGGMNFFDAINHSLTTMATGGFSTKQDSIAHFNSPFIHYVFILFMFFAGVNFTVHYRLLHWKFDVVKTNEEFKLFGALIAVTVIVVAIALILGKYGGVEKSFRDSLFQVVSLVTTTGYVTADYEIWGPSFKVLFFLLLFVGGCAGSTGGGIKIVRHLLIIKNSILELRRLIHPRAVLPVRFNGNSVSQDIISNVLAFFLFYFAIFILGTIVMSLTGLDFLSAMGSTATSLGNVGPAIASVGPTQNFSHISDFGKWFLSLLMLLGRLELFTVLILFSPSFWKR